MAQQTRAVNTRKAVLTAAAQAFDQHGYLGTSMGDILKIAGVTKGALYFHFQSKEDLAFAVVEAQTEGWEPLAADLLTTGGPGLRTLLDLSRAWAQRIKEDVLIRAGIRLTMERATFERPMPQLYDGWIELVDRLLRRGQKEGDVRGDIDIAAAAHFITAAFTGVQITSQVYTGYEDFADRIDEMWQLVLPGIAAPEALERHLSD